MTPEVSKCFECKHRIELHGVPAICKAFPQGIPGEIIYDGELHESIYPGQEGDFIFEKEYPEPSKNQEP